MTMLIFFFCACTAQKNNQRHFDSTIVVYDTLKMQVGDSVMRDTVSYHSRHIQIDHTRGGYSRLRTWYILVASSIVVMFIVIRFIGK